MLGKVTAYAYSQSTLINWKLKYIYFQQSSSSDLQHIGHIYLEAGPGFQTQKKIKLIIPLLFSDTSFVIFFFFFFTNICTNLRITELETWKSWGTPLLPTYLSPKGVYGHTTLNAPDLVWSPKGDQPGCSLEGLMLKVKLDYVGYLMWRGDSLEKTLMPGRIGGRRRRGWQRMRWLDGITD